MKKLKGKVKFKILDKNYTNALSYDKMPEWYNGINCLICTSLYEGCPLPVLEAASCGKAIVSTKVGIVPELLNNYINPPQSRKDVNRVINEFEKKILFYRDNGNVCELDGNYNRRLVKKFDWENIIERWRIFINVY